jgi:hypothetical protein
MYLRDQLHSGKTINVTDALKVLYKTEIADLDLNSLLDEAMRIHSKKRTSEMYGNILYKEIEKR